MRVDIMTDIETLGTSPDSTVFQVCAVAFNIVTGEMKDSFNEIIDVGMESVISDGDTLKWWLKTNKELFCDLLTSERATIGQHVFLAFQKWILKQTADYKDIYLWGNGIKFDNVMIDTQMKKYKIHYPIYYRNDRDVRTLLELASIKSGLSESDIKASVKNDSEVEHDAIDDCKYQIRLVCKCFDMLML